VVSFANKVEDDKLLEPTNYRSNENIYEFVSYTYGYSGD